MLSKNHVVSVHYNVSNTVATFTSTKKRSSQRQTLFLMIFLYVALCIVFSFSTTASVLLFVVESLIFHLIRRYEVTEESVLLIKDFGVQIRQKYASGFEEIKFLERANVEEVIIHEFIQGSSVGFSLAFKVQDSNLLVLTFKNVYPGLDFIKRVYLKCIEYEIDCRSY